MRRLSADAWIWIGLVLVVAYVIISTLGESQSQRGAFQLLPHRSSFNSRPDGYRGLYLTLGELGYRARRFRRSLTQLAGPGTLILAEPEPANPVTGAEWRTLLQWVQAGNLLVLTSEVGEGIGLETTAAPVIAGFGPAVVPANANSAHPSPASTGAPVLTTRSNLRIEDRAWTPRSLPTDPFQAAGGAQPEPLMEPVPLVPLYADTVGTVLAYTRHGQGVVILHSSPWSLSNEGISQGNNLALLLNLLDLYGGGKGGTIWFDEYHHGYGERDTLLTLAPPLLRVGLGHVALALLLMLLAAVRRFGATRLLPELEARSRAEYLTSMAGLFQRVRAWDVVFHRLRDLTMREMARDLGVPPGAGPKEIAQSAAERRGMDARQVEQTLDEAGRRAVDPASRNLPGRQALSLARSLARLRRDCRRTE